VGIRFVRQENDTRSFIFKTIYLVLVAQNNLWNWMPENNNRAELKLEPHHCFLDKTAKYLNLGAFLF